MYNQSLKTYTVRDIRKYHPTLADHYMRNYIKPTGDWRLLDGYLFHTYTASSIRTAMDTKRHVAMTSVRMSPSNKTRSLNNISLMLNALEQLEKETK